MGAFITFLLPSVTPVLFSEKTIMFSQCMG